MRQSSNVLDRHLDSFQQGVALPDLQACKDASLRQGEAEVGEACGSGGASFDVRGRGRTRGGVVDVIARQPGIVRLKVLI